ncbi:MAG: hypothetical protein WA030_01170 [Candidatus Microsaccharimonas sp.]
MTKQRLRIGFDVDDVLINSVDVVIELNNRLYGSSLVRHQWYDMTIADLWGVPTAHDITGRVDELIRHPDYRQNIKALAGAFEVLRDIKDHYELFAITGRSTELRAETLWVLNQCFPGLFSDETLHMTNFKAVDGYVAGKRNKLDVARELELTHFVDDLPTHANLLAEGGVKTVLFNDNYAWSEGDHHPDLVRVSNWQELKKYLDHERQLI